MITSRGTLFQAKSRQDGMETLPTVLFPASYLAALVLERIAPARPLPAVRGWLGKGLVCFAIAGVLNAVLPLAVATALGGHRLLDLSRLPLAACVAIAFVAGDLAGYAIHRTMHRFDRLWRWTHQVHHSAERVDIAGFSYAHPLDQLVTFGLAAVVGVGLGAPPLAASIAGYALFAVQLISHLNVRTPRWLGFVIQRPEMHALHHGRGVHAYNYGTTALWDLVLGTHRNPPGFVDATGFWDGASARVGAMLLGRAVDRRA
jgi:sterol desaturase/sphingolipid hydroxylase (fatty acid hydroxylase superfamily)